ncbi:universal stress protein [Trichothermofontia sichuanensis B231]|uniref:universal stress protein n=1 Tax=Trichothermofontia sichuanensis TaxID=3045816 RepID=UPI0022477CCA|nr:universal stress protein [Trichothermofontia sichuanensis]UZQ55875.1 universal stress protein [Trichothermofontia sichuanensis B231]
MTMYQRILIPIDGSPCSQAALHHGLQLAHAIGAEVTLLHILENPLTTSLVNWMGPGPTAYSYDLLQDLRKAAQTILATAAQQAAQFPVMAQTVLIEEDFPATVIVQQAQDHDLVVMGTHGRKGIDRLFIGSITEGVLRNTQTPLLIVHPDPQPG